MEKDIHKIRKGSKIKGIEIYKGIIWGDFTITRVGASVSGPGYYVEVEGVPEGHSSVCTLSGFVYSYFL